MSGGLALGSAAPAMAAADGDPGSQVAAQDAGTPALPGAVLPQQASHLSVPALPPLPGSAPAASAASRSAESGTAESASTKSSRGYDPVGGYGPTAFRPLGYDGPGGPGPNWHRWHNWNGANRWHHWLTPGHFSVGSAQTLVLAHLPHMGHFPGACCAPPPPPCCHRPWPRPRPWLRIVKSANRTVAHPGDVVTYTVRFRNTGDGWFPPYRPQVITDHLRGVLKNATFLRGSLSASRGAVRFNRAARTVTWIGRLGPGRTGSFSYQVRVRRSGAWGAHPSLDNVVNAPRSNCMLGATGPLCRVHIPIVVRHRHVRRRPQLAHTGAGGMTEAGLAAVAFLTTGAGLGFGARRARR